jgi:hypothetical protein
LAGLLRVAGLIHRATALVLHCTISDRNPRGFRWSGARCQPKSQAGRIQALGPRWTLAGEILERDASGEIETVDEDFFRAVECVDWSNAEPARDDTVRA